MLRWGAEREPDSHFIDPGKPTQNGHVESFNGKARDAVAAWLIDFNEIRSHSAVRGLTPKEFVQTLAAKSDLQLSAA